MIARRVYKPVFAAFLISVCLSSAAIAHDNAIKETGGTSGEIFDCVVEPSAADYTGLPLPGSIPPVDYVRLESCRGRT